jgi:transcriptional regulator with PAS, ATPase and Fis domain
LDELVVGRGAERAVEAQREGGVQRLSVRVEDRWMSSAHARFRRELGHWYAEDLGSKNGTLVNGAVQSRAALADGDVIEVGHSFFLFAEDAALPPDEPLEGAGPVSIGPGLTTLSPELAQVLAGLALLSRSTVPLLLEGETGTGKEVVARAVHQLSGRQGAFVAVNCGALPDTLLETELFGYKKGAFSGATDDRPGLVRTSDRGTLFLDEIGDLPASSQAALLRVLQEREVTPVGGTRPIPVDLRVIAATHRELERLVADGGFRADLFQRLAGHRSELPPLRQRREDLGLLMGALLERHGGRELALESPAALALLRHDWPGNVRELEQSLSAAAVLATDGMIRLEQLAAPVREALAPVARDWGPKSEAEEAARKEQLIALLKQHHGNLAAVARAMGKARMQVQRWLKRYDLDPDSFRR